MSNFNKNDCVPKGAFTTNQDEEQLKFHNNNNSKSKDLEPTTRFQASQSTSSSPKNTSSVTKKRRMPLTLSAYRGIAVRLTDCAVGENIEQLYKWPEPEIVIGRGASSVVRLCTRRSDGRYFAVKCIKKYEILREKKQKLFELQLLRKLSHRNVVPLIDAYETDIEIQLVLEFCAGGELFDVVEKKKYSERDAACVTHGLLEALEYLHEQKIVHRDIKPENILLPDENDDTVVKLSGELLLVKSYILKRLRLIISCSYLAYPNHIYSEDFGLARLLSPEQDEVKHLPVKVVSTDSLPVSAAVSRTWVRNRAYSSVGSDFYSAPEVMLGGRKGYDESVDMYSLGVVIYILLCGFPPFDNRLSRTNLTFPDSHWINISVSAKDLIRQLLSINPVARPTAKEALKHTWIQNRDKFVSNEPISSTHLDEMRKFNNMRRSGPSTSPSVLTKRLHSLSKESQSTLTRRLHLGMDMSHSNKKPRIQDHLSDPSVKAVYFGKQSPPCVTPR